MMRDPTLFSEAIATTIMPDRTGRVISTTPLGTDVEMDSGEVLRRLPLAGSAKAGDTVKLRYAAGRYTVLGNQTIGGGSSSVVGGGSSGGGGSVDTHDFLGSYHILPTVSANNILAGPSGSSGFPSFRAIVLADIQSAADTRYVPLTRTLTGGDGINVIGDLSADRTISVDYGAGLTISSGALVIGTPTTLSISTTNSATGTTHAHAVTYTTVGAVSTLVATNPGGDIVASRHLEATGGTVTSSGITAGLLFQDRGLGVVWQWYGSTSIARFQNASTAADLIVVGATGNTSIAGTLTGLNYIRSTGASSEVGWEDRTQVGGTHRWSWQTSTAGTASLVANTGGTRVTVTEAGGMVITGNLTETGLTKALGSASGYYTADRTTSGDANAWTMYADFGLLRWSFNGTDKMSVDTSGYAVATRFGAGVTSPAHALDGRSGSNQLRLSVDASGYTLFSVSGGGDLTITPSGTLVKTNSLAYTGTFLSGFAGAGWRLDTNIARSGATTLELDDLVVRGRMRVYELLITQIRATNGNVFVTATGKIKTVTGSGPYTLSSGSGTSNQDDPYHHFLVGDLIRAQRFIPSTATLYQCNLQVTAVTDLYTFTATLISGDAPLAGMDFVRLGNVSDTTRQGSIYLSADDSGAPFIDILDGVASFADWGTSAKNKARIGKLSGVTDSFFGTLAGYGIYTNNAYLRGAKINGSVIIGSGIALSLAASLYVKGDTAPNSFTPNWNGHLGQRPTVIGGVNGFPVGPFRGAGALAISEASTNLVINPHFGHGTPLTGWVTGGSATATIVAQGLFGTNALSLACTGGAGNRYVATAITRTSTANPLTVHAWVYSPTPNARVKIGVWRADLLVASASTDFTVGDGWTYISWTASVASMSGFSTSVNVIIANDTDTTNKTIIIGHVQAEEKLYATTSFAGDFGAGFAWASTAHQSISTRTAGGLDYAAPGNMPSLSGTVMTWFWAGTANSGTSAGYRVFIHSLSGGFLVLRLTDTNKLQGYWGTTPVTSTASVTANTWHHAAMTSDGVTMRLYLDGTEVASGAATGIVAPSTIGIGAYSSGTQQWLNGYIADMVITERLLTADEIQMTALANAPLAITRSNFEVVLAEGGYKIVGNAGGLYATDPNGIPTFTLLNSTQTIGANYITGLGGESLTTSSLLLGNNNSTTGGANLLYNGATGALTIRNKQTPTISLLATANAAGQIATFDGVIGITTNGGIWQGSVGTFAAPNTGYKLYSSGGKAVWETWLTGVKQVYTVASDMSLRAGAGNVVLDASGISLYNLTNGDTATYLKFVANDGTNLGKWSAYGDTTHGYTSFYISPATAVTPAIHELILSNSGTSESSISLNTVSTTSFDNVSIDLYSGTTSGAITMIAPDLIEIQTKLMKFTVNANTSLVMGLGAWSPTTGTTMSLGNTSIDYTPTSAAWSALNGNFATLVLNGLNYSVIAFHDSGSRVDAIRVGAGVITLGYDAGWGTASVSAPGGIAAASFTTANYTGSVGVSSAVTLSITLPAIGSYIVTCRLTGSNTEVVLVSAVSYNLAILNVGWTTLNSKSFSLGSIALATQDGGGQFGFNASSNGVVKATFTTGAAAATYYATVTRIA